MRSSRRTGCRQSVDVAGEEIDVRDDGVTLYRDGRLRASTSDDDFGPRVVESLAPRGVSYTPYADEAVAAVDRGEARRRRSSCGR